MATIKRSELNALKKACADNREDADYYCKAWLKKLYEVVAASVRNQDLKDKLWAAEQEVHDLKYDLEREKNEHDRATDEWEQLVAEQDKDINDLSNWVIDLLQKPTVIDPPACLKPKDAISYVANLVYYDPISTTVPQNHTWTVRTFS